VIDEPRLRGMLRRQAPAFAEAVLHHVVDGWDCTIWRVGEDHVARVPIREPAIDRLRNELQRLAAVTARLDGVIETPRIVVAGKPDDAYDRPWTLETWIHGEVGLRIPRIERRTWGARLVEVLRVLHTPASGFRPNPARGIPLAEKEPAIHGYIEIARASGFDEHLKTIVPAWEAGLAAAPYEGEPLWLHGDLHLANMIGQDGELVGLIDWGDATGGDPAYDLAVAWLALPAEARMDLRAGYGGDDALWTRARACAAATSVTFLARCDDYPPYQGAGFEGALALRDG